MRGTKSNEGRARKSKQNLKPNHTRAGTANPPAKGNTKMTTQEQKRRIIEAIAECDRYIEREGKRIESLRPESEKKHLNFCLSHRAKLNEMLKA
jgi:hypothetical protein